MEYVTKLERKVLGWFKSAPNLPNGGRRWLGENVWWIVLVGTILTAIGILTNLAGLSRDLSIMNTVAETYYVSSAVTTWAIVTTIVALVFSVLEVILLAIAIQPLKEKQKKGWVLLFGAWLISTVSIVVSALLTLSLIGFIITILFGGVWSAITGYFLFEIHGEFAHVERSRGVKNAAKDEE